MEARKRTALACAMAALAISACGESDRDDGQGDRPALPEPAGAHLFDSPAYSFSSHAQPAVRRVTVDGATLKGGSGCVVVVRVGLRNKRRAKLNLGQMTAVIRTRAGRSVDPVLADGREVADPLFGVASLPPGRQRNALVAYRLALIWRVQSYGSTTPPAASVSTSPSTEARA
jgi:hypothetical protein